MALEVATALVDAATPAFDTALLVNTCTPKYVPNTPTYSTAIVVSGVACIRPNMKTVAPIADIIILSRVCSNFTITVSLSGMLIKGKEKMIKNE